MFGFLVKEYALKYVELLIVPLWIDLQERVGPGRSSIYGLRCLIEGLEGVYSVAKHPRTPKQVLN